MDFNRLSVLLQKRRTLKENIDTFKEFLDQFEIQNSALFPELQVRMQSMKSAFLQIDEIYDEIQLIDTETNHSSGKKSLQNSYFEILGKAQYCIESVGSRSSSMRNSISQASMIENDNINASVTQPHIDKLKLPVVKIPTFDGKLEKFLTFKNRFVKMVHNRKDMSNLIKFQYLESALQGEALRKISIFDISEENYSRAWGVLLNAYEDRRLLISRHMSLLLRIPVQEKETYQGLILLADESQQHVQSLASLGINITPEMVVTIIEEKLHKITLEKWEDTLKRGEFPTFESLTEFLYKTAARMSKRKGAHLNVKDDYESSSSSKKRKIELKSNGQTFLTTANSKCPLCSESHPLFKCSKFHDLSVEDRHKAVKNASLCFNCLRKHAYKAKECRFGKCKKCSKQHNTLLHFDKVQDESSSKKL